MNKKSLFCLLKMFVFIVIGMFIFGIFSRVLPQKWYYPNNDVNADTRIITGFYDEMPNTIDIVACGVSHMQWGFSPMELYEKYGFTSYNMATGGQPIQVSYYILKEVLKKQTPKIFIYDANSLFYVHTTSPQWREVLDNFNLSLNKAEMVNEFVNECPEETCLSSLFPLLRYHERWKELSISDFTDFYRNMHYYSKGYTIDSRRATVGCGSVQNMNEETNYLINDAKEITMKYSDGQYSCESNESPVYAPFVPVENISWLVKMKELCENNGITFLVTKVPCVFWPQSDSAAWTLQKRDIVKEICESNGISFLDVLYNENADENVDIDWISESYDGGHHLNLFGAQKITEKIGNYLLDNYEIPSRINSVWDNDLKIYQQVRNIAYLQMEQNFIEYLQKLVRDYKDKTIFITVKDDIGGCIDDEDRTALKVLGLQTDFSDVFRHSYLAIIESGNISYEALSNRYLSYSNNLAMSGISYKLISSNWHTNSNASIMIDNKEYAINQRGMNIVVYDEENKMVLDRVCFDLDAYPHVCIRDIQDTGRLLHDYEYYRIEGVKNKF